MSNFEELMAKAVASHATPVDNTELKCYVSDLECNLDELNECGHLEDRMDAAVKLSTFRLLLLKLTQANKVARFIPCKLCRGTGERIEHGQGYDCTICEGLGGHYAE